MKAEVLDHGYVEFIESWGTGKAGQIFEGMVAVRRDCEIGIIEAARQSTQKGFLGWSGSPCSCSLSGWSDSPSAQQAAMRAPLSAHDKGCTFQPGDFKLLTYLYEHAHNTPFEFAGMVLEVQAPIFVFREWHRHRTQSYNEMSARYAPLPDLYYRPTYDVMVMRAQAATANKQAQGAAPFDPEDADQWLVQLDDAYKRVEWLYQEGLKRGIPKELARVIMPVGHYTRMRVHANLRNWLAFMTLRCDPNAQWEIRQYAWTVAEFIHRTFPLTWSLWEAEFDAQKDR